MRGLEGIGPGRLVGVGAVIVAWLAFAMHDATVKLLVADASAWQVLFARSVLVLPFCLAIATACIAQTFEWPGRCVGYCC